MSWGFSWWQLERGFGGKKTMDTMVFTLSSLQPVSLKAFGAGRDQRLSLPYELEYKILKIQL